MPTLSPELQPVVLVHDLTSTPGPDQEYIVEAAVSTQPAVAANNSHVQLTNDSTDSLLRLVYCQVSQGTIGFSNWIASLRKNVPTVALATTVVRLNQRVRPSLYSSNRLASEATGAGVSGTSFFASNSGLAGASDSVIPTEVLRHVVLGPGDAMQLTAIVPNTPLVVSLCWTQEPLNPVYGQ